MKALNRKEALVNAKANGTLDGFKPLTREEAFTKKALGLGGGASSWNDLTDKPFYEEVFTYNLKVAEEGSASEGYADIKSFDGINANHAYTFVIRGDVYPNIKAVIGQSYYDYYMWGTTRGGDFIKYPFGMWAQQTYAGETMWNEDGTFNTDNGNYIEPPTSFRWDSTRYPNLDIENEVKIYRTEVKRIDPKYSPTAVVNITVDEGSGTITADKTANEIANLVSSGVNVIAVDNMGSVYYADDIHKDTDGTGAVRFYKVMWDYGVHRGYIRLTWTGDNKTVNIEQGGIESVDMMSPNGTVYTVTVDDNGTLKVEPM